MLRWNLAEIVQQEVNRTGSKVLCMHFDIDDPIQQSYEWQNSDMSVRSWTEELKEEL
jgi:hypothetical protein